MQILFEIAMLKWIYSVYIYKWIYSEYIAIVKICLAIVKNSIMIHYKWTAYFYYIFRNSSKEVEHKYKIVLVTDYDNE